MVLKKGTSRYKRVCSVPPAGGMGGMVDHYKKSPGRLALGLFSFYGKPFCLFLASNGLALDNIGASFGWAYGLPFVFQLDADIEKGSDVLTTATKALLRVRRRLMSKRLPRIPSPRQARLQGRLKKSLSEMAHDTKQVRWDDAKIASSAVSAAFFSHSSARVKRWGERMASCAHEVVWEWKKRSDGHWESGVRHAELCRVKVCPSCMWRKSLKIQKEICDRLATLKRKYPELRPMLLTLTVKNVRLENLRATAKDMLKGWSRLTRRVAWRGVEGWVRGLEVTPGKQGPGQAHPHIHALLLVSPEWDIEGADWGKQWAEVMGLDYRPVVDIRPVHSIKGAAKEVGKYCAKGLTADSDFSWLAEIALSLDGVRPYATGGLLKEKADPEDVAREEKIVPEPPVVPGKQAEKRLVIVYHWKKLRYLRFLWSVDPPDDSAGGDLGRARERAIGSPPPSPCASLPPSPEGGRS